MSPRRRDEEEEQTKVEEDFLEVDKPVPGQNYCCISFVSPDKVLEKKESVSVTDVVLQLNEEIKNGKC